MNVPSGPVSSASTAPAQAPIRMAIAAPENHVTSTSATPKNPNWASLRVTTLGIQIVADKAKPAIATLVMTPEGMSTRHRTSPRRRNHAVNHHRENVVASETTANNAMPGPLPRSPRNTPRNAMHTSTTMSHAGPSRVRADLAAGRPSPQPRDEDALQSGRERAREEDREHEPEDAGRFPYVVGTGERFFGGGRRVAAHTEAVRQAGEDRLPDALRKKGGDHDNEGEERDECLPGQGDTAVDELDLEHALPNAPHQCSLEPLPPGVDASPNLFEPSGLGRAFVSHLR